MLLHNSISVVRRVIDLASLYKKRIYCRENLYIYRFSGELSDINSELNISYLVCNHRDNDTNRNEKINFYLDNGCTIYTTMNNGSFVGRCVVCELKKYRPNLYNKCSIFDNNHVYYIFHCMTAKEYRGNNAFPLLLNKISTDIKDANPYAETMITSNVKNIASQKGLKKAKFDKIGRLAYLEIFGYVLTCKFTEQNSSI